MPLQSMDMMGLMEKFGTEQDCRKVLEEIRWPKGAVCSRCEGTEHAYDSKRGVFDCYGCGYQFSVLAGTIFHDTKLPLRKWMMAVLLMVEARKGVSANQIKRTLGVSYKTAWYLCHRIRAAMAEARPEPLSGTVEVDETYHGGKARNMHRNQREGNKTIVAGAVQRGGRAILQVVDSTTRKTLHGFVNDATLPATERIITDEWPAYRGVGDRDTIHETVNHRIREYVRRGTDVHTQTIESVWSLFKRSVVGSYHKLSTKHLDAYLNELEWRFNNRGNKYLFRDTLKKLLAAEKLEYRELTAKA